MSKSRSEPCLRTNKRERRQQYHEEGPPKLLPFRTLFPLPAKGIDMRRETARNEASANRTQPAYNRFFF